MAGPGLEEWWQLKSQPATRATNAPMACEPTLIVVDDDPEVRIIISEYLEDSGYRVLQADGGASALMLLESHPETRVVVTDIRMPDMSGVELADRVTQRRNGLKVILISGYSASRVWAIDSCTSRSACRSWQRRSGASWKADPLPMALRSLAGMIGAGDECSWSRRAGNRRVAHARVVIRPAG